MLHDRMYATKKYDASGCRLTQSVMRHPLESASGRAFTSVAISSLKAPSATESNTGEAGIGERREIDTAGNSVIEDA